MARNRKRAPLPREPVVLDIEKLSHEGRGIAHVDGKVVFVDEALPGERVLARYRSRRNSFDEATVVEVLQPSAHRVTPRCPHASVCGGCSLQHFDAEAQLAFKEATLHEKLAHSTGNAGYERLPAITGPAYGYRRKARLAARYVQKKDRVLLGFREKHTPYIADMDSCEVLDPAVARLLPELGPLLRGLACFREIPQIEVAVGDPLGGVNAMALVVRHIKPLSDNDRETLVDFATARGFDLYLQPGGPSSLVKAQPADTPERLYYELPDFDLVMAFHPLDFTQVNPWVNRQMLTRAIELLEPRADERILDLFCGLGNFTLPLARHAGHVIGVEGVEEMVRRGYENAERNGIGNVGFHCADLALGTVGREWMTQGFDKVLLDPPRSGAEEALPGIIACEPRRILYISCNPATLARDAALLQEGGYALRAAGVLDMFPHTTHVEAMALFTPRQ